MSAREEVRSMMNTDFVLVRIKHENLSPEEFRDLARQAAKAVVDRGNDKVLAVAAMGYKYNIIWNSEDDG